jgi:toxin FitB
LSYLLDTNALSEFRRGSAEAVQWPRPIDPERLFISVWTLGEIERGVLKLAKRDAIGATRLAAWLAVTKSDFRARTLPVSRDVALSWGRLPLPRTIGVVDALLAATAIAHGLEMVTRNVRDFEDTGVKLVNPWAQS